jgi:hypothetical protein
MALIPAELRAAIEEFECFHWYLLEGAHQCAEFRDYLIQSVSRFGPVFIAVSLQLLRPHEAHASRRSLFFRQLARLSPQTALTWLAGRQIAPGAARVLQRLDRSPSNDHDLMALCLVMSDPRKLALLQQQRVIYSGLLKAFAVMPNWLWTSHVLRVINSDRTDCAALTDAIIMARDRVTHSQDQALLLTYLSRARNVDSFMTRLDGELTEFCWDEDQRYRLPEQRVLDPYPPPPYPATATLVPITNLHMLQQEARRMGNCLEMYDATIREGIGFVYRWHGNQRASILLTRMTVDDLWNLDEVEGYRQTEIEDSTISAIKLALGHNTKVFLDDG